MTLKEQIHGWMAGREDEFVEALAPLIAIDSTMGEPAPGAPFGVGPGKALDAALALAEKWGFAVSNDDGYVGLVDLNDQPDKLHILAHLDVVGVGEHDFDARVHGANERASLTLLLRAAEIYAAVIAKLCA